MLFAIFLVFSSFSLKIQAQVLIDYEVVQDMDRFDWSAFSNKSTIRADIEFENKIFNLLGPGSTIGDLNIGKSDLIRLEQELDLYRQGRKTGLSPNNIKLAEEAIALHWSNINNIEAQIKAYAGIGIKGLPPKPKVGSVEDYYNGVWELHEGDHQVVFNMVEKKDQALYNTFGGNDEAYTRFIAPYVKRQMQKMNNTAKAYYQTLDGDLDYEIIIRSDYSEIKKQFKTLNVANLIDLYIHSLEIYNCFNKNFTNRVGVNQQSLMNSIRDWHTEQALLGANSLIQIHNVYGYKSNPSAVVMELLGFYKAPNTVKEQIISFLRDDIFYNSDYINTDDRKRLGARVDALIGFNSFGMATAKEEELFNKAIEQGIIKYYNPYTFFGRSLPLPE